MLFLIMMSQAIPPYGLLNIEMGNGTDAKDRKQKNIFYPGRLFAGCLNQKILLLHIKMYNAMFRLPPDGEPEQQNKPLNTLNLNRARFSGSLATNC